MFRTAALQDRCWEVDFSKSLKHIYTPQGASRTIRIDTESYRMNHTADALKRILTRGSILLSTVYRRHGASRVDICGCIV